MRRTEALALAALIALASPALAEDRPCRARVNAQDLIIVPGLVEGASPGLAERVTTLPSRLWDRAWGEPSDCSSAAIITFLARSLALEETDGYCLTEGEEGWLLVPGARNFRGRCRATTCDLVNAARDEAVGLAAFTASLLAGRRIATLQDGVQAVAHGSGAMLLSGQGPALAQSLGTGASAVGTALASPAIAGAAAVTVVAVGGAVYLCSGD